jgi:predicted Fe-Mo cluster-binding NifX family protein
VGADIIAVSYLEAKDAKRCSELGITVLCGASGRVRDVLDQVRNGTLSSSAP